MIAMWRVHTPDLEHFGAVAERLKATVLKTVVPKGTGGSNPSCSVQ